MSALNGVSEARRAIADAITILQGARIALEGRAHLPHDSEIIEALTAAGRCTRRALDCLDAELRAGGVA